jgi:hypothetical protein
MDVLTDKVVTIKALAVGNFTDSTWYMLPVNVPHGSLLNLAWKRFKSQVKRRANQIDSLRGHKWRIG